MIDVVGLDHHFHLGIALQVGAGLIARIVLLYARNQQHEHRRRNENGNAGLGPNGLARVSGLVHGLSFSDAETTENRSQDFVCGNLARYASKVI